MHIYGVAYLVLILAGLGSIAQAAILVSEQRENSEGISNTRFAIKSLAIVVMTFGVITLVFGAFATFAWAMSTYVCDGPCLYD